MVDVPPIDFTARGVRIGDRTYDPVPVSALISTFGEPVKPAPPTREDGAEPPRNRWLVWDALGIRASTVDGEAVTELDVNLVEDPGHLASVRPEMRPYFASGSYPGAVSVHGVSPLDAVPSDTLDRPQDPAPRHLDVVIGRAASWRLRWQCGQKNEERPWCTARRIGVPQRGHGSPSLP